MSTTQTEMEPLKTRLRSMWMAGDYGQIAAIIQPGADKFIASLALTSGDKVLDVACGSGNLTIPAARTGASVTGVDIAPNLLEQARTRAESEGLTIQLDEGDAESLRYPDEAFDVVVTMFGAMFAPRPELVSSELVRVCKRGGRIAMANWTPAGFIGQMFKVMGKHVPPPPNMPSPIKWGDEETVRERLRDGVADLTLTRRICRWEFSFAPADVVEYFRMYYGPTQRAFGALDENGQAALRKELEQLWSDSNRATDGSTDVDAEYLEVVATRS